MLAFSVSLSLFGFRCPLLVVHIAGVSHHDKGCQGDGVYLVGWLFVVVNCCGGVCPLFVCLENFPFCLVILVTVFFAGRSGVFGSVCLSASCWHGGGSTVC